ncbi:hypothetical protein BDF22DRAFT_760425 [Syncephalis plumigaleata]|nr:hypothetical protein BDF22DRAFT_760425 [Syncephalis plumigaleata]
MNQFYYLIAAAFCAIAVTIGITGSEAAFGAIGGSTTDNAAGRIYLNNPVNAKNNGLTNINWLGGHQSLAFASAFWNNEQRFMKCGVFLQKEADVFTILKDGEKQAAAQNHPGKNHIQHPLHAFSNGNENCFVYNFVPGTMLVDYFDSKPAMARVALFARVLPQILLGASYLHSLGVVHGDLNRRNVLIYESPRTGQLTATIIDYDLSSLLNEAETRKDLGRIAETIKNLVEGPGFEPMNPQDMPAYYVRAFNFLWGVKKETATPDQQKAAIKIIEQLDSTKE